MRLHALFFKKSRARSGFTLIELLVAMAVLALVLVLMLQVVDNIMRSTRVQNQQMDSVASARRALDILEADLRSAVISRDTTLLAAAGAGATDINSRPQIAFHSQRRGPEGGGGHRFLYLAYATNDRGWLLRAYQSAPHSETNLLQILAPPPDAREEVAEGILQLRMRAVTESGDKVSFGQNASANWATNRYNGFGIPAGYQAIIAPGPDFATGLTNRTRAIEVWIAALDPQNYALVQQAASGTPLASELATAEPETWRERIDAANIPPSAKSSARILHKTISLP